MKTHDKPWEDLISLTRPLAAKEQTIAAIRLFFRGNEPAATHTLAAAGNQLISDYHASKGSGGFIRNKHLINSEKYKDWLRAINETQNKLKHADRDPYDTVEIKPLLTIIMMLESAILIELAVGEYVPEFKLFSFWTMATYPEWYSLEPKQFEVVSELKTFSFEAISDVLNSQKYLEEMARNAYSKYDYTPPEFPSTPFDLYLKSISRQ